MKHMTLVLLLTASAAVAQPLPWTRHGQNVFLVNYGAIGGDRFLARFAASRFDMIDEGSRTDIALIHAQNPALPVLVYRDVVALHRSFPEFAETDLDESAFLHTADPAGVVMRLRRDTATLCWLADRRALAVAGYRVLSGPDSLSCNARLVDTLVTGTRLTVRLPKSAARIRIATATADGRELNYGVAVPVQPAPDAPPFLAVRSIACARGPSVDTVAVTVAREDGGIPDSVVLACDANRDNTIDTVRERLRMQRAGDAWTAVVTIPYGTDNRGGYEFIVLVYADGLRRRIPGEGMYTTDVNNRMINDTYGFYVMNVGSSTWRRAYIGQVLGAFASSGYTGLFEDDTWYRVERWGADAFPPAAYDEATWKRDLYGFLDSIRTAIAPRPAYFNGLYADRSDSLLLHADGGMTEGFAYTHWSQYVASSAWKTQCDIGLRCQHRFGRAWLALAGAPAADPDARLYAFASYLLAADTLSMYATATDYQEFSHFPEFDIDLGRPLTTAALSVDELKKTDANGTAYYERAFERGTVTVNPDPSASVSAPLPEDAAMLQFTPGTTVDGSRVTTTAAAAAIPPRRARIVLKDLRGVLASPVIERITIAPNPVPGDAATAATIMALVRDDTSPAHRADTSMPLHVTADLGPAGGPKELRLLNDGSHEPGAADWYRADFTLPYGAPPRGVDVPVTACGTTGLAAVGWAHLDIASADSSNLLPNFSFEIDDNEDGVPDSWSRYGRGFDYDTSGAAAVTGRRSVHVRNDSASQSRGIGCSIPAPIPLVDLELSGWSIAGGVSGKQDGNYALYADVYYEDGTALYGRTAQFGTGTHGWERASTVFRPAKPVKSISLYALFRGHTGEAWFDQVALREYRPPAGITRVPESVPLRVFPIAPSPARATATLRYALGTPGRVTVTVYDALGRTVSAAGGSMQDAGDHALELDLRAIPPGAYRCVVTAGADMRQTGLVVTGH